MSWRRRLPVILLGLCVIEGIALAFWLWSIRYVIQVTGSEPSWIVIEYRNPKCPRLPASLMGRHVVVPPDGYVCFSDEPVIGAMILRVRDRDGRHVEDERVRKFGLTTGTPAQDPGCHLTAQGFFFGTDQELVQSEEDVGTKLRAHHAGCR